MKYISPFRRSFHHSYYQHTCLLDTIYKIKKVAKVSGIFSLLVCDLPGGRDGGGGMSCLSRSPPAGGGPSGGPGKGGGGISLQVKKTEKQS